MDDVARLDDLERRLSLLRQAVDRLTGAPRVHPGTPTFWSGPARRQYERTVLRLDEDLDAGLGALREAIGTTTGLLGTLRHDG